jgi:hypothetical protein
MKHIIWVLWPAFIAAGIAETVFFTVIDPKQLYLMGQAVELSPMATYSLGFLMFWLMCAGSSLMTWFMLPQDIKRTLEKLSREHLDLSHRQRVKP